MDRQISQDGRRKSYQPQDMEEAMRKVRKGLMCCSHAASLHGIPKSSLWYNLSKEHNSPVIKREGQNTPKEQKVKSKVAVQKKSPAGHKMSEPQNCYFCGLGEENEVEFGKLHTAEDISVHYYCLLFSSGLAQNGEDNEGILGFLVEDIWKEVHRGKKLSCCYCLRKGATVGCYNKKCRRTYHYPCGVKQNVLFKFSNDFRSYCGQHREYQKGYGVGEELECPICMEELIADPKQAVWAPCCQRKTWFHKLCLQKLALSAGYFFKCPLCNDKDVFQSEMQNLGIYVPEKDASWELEPNAFSELLERPIHCDAPKCKCPDGRKTDVDGTRWEILLCSLCGSTGVHIACGGLPFICTEWNCSTCVNMLADSFKRTKQEERDRRLSERKSRASLSNDTNMNDGNCSSDNLQSSTLSDAFGSSAGCSGTITPGKRKMENSETGFETPPKMRLLDSMETSRITYASDSDEEIDVDSGECQVPPHIIIRDLEEHGEELPKKLQKLKNFALRAQERMQELRLTETDIVKMAKESSQRKDVLLDKSQVKRFFRYKLPLEKMLQIAELLKKIFALREAMILEAQSSSTKKKKGAAYTPSTRKSRRALTPDIRIPLLKTAINQSMIATGLSPSSKTRLESVEECDDSTKNDVSMQGSSKQIENRVFVKKESEDSFQANTPTSRTKHKKNKEYNEINEVDKTDNVEPNVASESDAELSLAMSPFSEASVQMASGKVEKTDNVEEKVNKENEGFVKDGTPVACRKLLLNTPIQKGLEFKTEENDTSASAFIGRNTSSERKVDTTPRRPLMDIANSELPGFQCKPGAADDFDVIKTLEFEDRSFGGLEDLDFDEVLRSNVDSVPDFGDENFDEVMMSILSIPSGDYNAVDRFMMMDNPVAGELNEFDGFSEMPILKKETSYYELEQTEKNIPVLSPNQHTVMPQAQNNVVQHPSFDSNEKSRSAKHIPQDGSQSTVENKIVRKKFPWREGLKKAFWGWYRLESLEEEEEVTSFIGQKFKECYVVLQCLPPMNKVQRIKVINEDTIQIRKGRTQKLVTLKNYAKQT